jgi:hypothetical protein
MFSERVRTRLQDIVDDVDRVGKYLGDVDADGFVRDEKTVLVIERLFQRITEAVIQIGADDMARIGGDIPIAQIRGFGNRLRHDYRDIDPRLLFTTARTQLPALRAAAMRALES